MKRILLSILVIGILLLGVCGIPAPPSEVPPVPPSVEQATPPERQEPTPAPTTSPAPAPEPKPEPEPPPTLTSQEKSPPITIALDYFGIRNTHWINQLGSEKAEVQLVIMISDDIGTLVTWPPDPQSQTFPMDFFQVISLKNYIGVTTVLYTGSVTGTLSIRVVANNVNKGAITKAQIDIIKALGGGDLTALKALIHDPELIGTCWQTWLPINNWGIGSQYTNDDPQGNVDLKIWGRIGSNQMPPELSKPILKPNVKIEDVKLPTGVRVRQPSEQWFFNTWKFEFIIANYESFEFPVYWHLESSTSPETKDVNNVHPTEGKASIRGNDKVPIETWYWFKTPGDYQWKYIVECPKGNQVASWEGTLKVSP